MKSAMAEESIIAMALREPALLDHAGELKQEMFSSTLLGSVYGQLCDRHVLGQNVSLSGLVGFEPEEMSHIAGLLRKQEGPVSEQAFRDCIRTIRQEHETGNVQTDADLLELRNKMKERKGIKA
jgi:DNA primase